MNRAWMYVIIGGLVETSWSSTMKMSDGLTDPLYTILTMILLVVSVWFLNIGLKSELPMGICYAVWVGIGAIGSAAVGSFLFGDSMTSLGGFFLVLMISAIIAMNLVPEKKGTQRYRKRNMGRA